MKNGFGIILYKSIIIFLMFLTVVTIGISAFDIIRKAVKSGRNFIIIAGGSYFLTGIIAFTLGLSRLFNVRRALNDIPKTRIPIHKPKFVDNLITSKLIYVSKIDGKPRPEDGGQPGWGKPGSSYDNIHFRSSIIETFSVIEQEAVKYSSIFARQPSMSVKRYIDFLIEHEIIDRELGHAYVEGYERARFSDEEVPQEQYTKFMKLVIQLLRPLGFSGN